MLCAKRPVHAGSRRPRPAGPAGQQRGTESKEAHAKNATYEEKSFQYEVHFLQHKTCVLGSGRYFSTIQENALLSDDLQGFAELPRLSALVPGASRQD